MNQLTALIAPHNQPATYDSDTLDHALTAARTHLGMPSAFLVAIEGDDLMTIAVSNRHADSTYRAGVRYPARGSIAQMVLDDNLPQLIPDMSRAAVVQRQATKIGAMISVPIPLHLGGYTVSFAASWTCRGLMPLL